MSAKSLGGGTDDSMGTTFWWGLIQPRKDEKSKDRRLTGFMTKNVNHWDASPQLWMIRSTHCNFLVFVVTGYYKKKSLTSPLRGRLQFREGTRV